MRLCMLQSLLFVTQVEVVNVSNKSPLMDEHAFPLTEFISWLA